MKGKSYLWLALLLAVFVVLFVCVSCKKEEARILLPVEDEIVPLGMSHVSGLEISGGETDALVVNQTSTGDILELRDDGTVVQRVLDGGAVTFLGHKLDLDADSDTSITVDTDDQLDVELAGVDTLVMKPFPTSATVTATINVVEIQGTSPAWTANTNTVNALDIDLAVGNAQTGTHAIRAIMIDAISGDAHVTETGIELGSGWDVGLDVNGLKIDLDADADTSITADTDDQIDIEISDADDFRFTANTFTALAGSTIEVNNLSETTAAAGVTIDDELTVSSTFFPSIADETITDGEVLTPTKTIYVLDSGGAVTMTLAASGTEGQILILIGDDANNITVNDTNIRTNDGGVQVIGQYDVIIWIYQDSEWIEISESNNS